MSPGWVGANWVLSLLELRPHGLRHHRLCSPIARPNHSPLAPHRLLVMMLPVTATSVRVPHLPVTAHGGRAALGPFDSCADAAPRSSRCPPPGEALCRVHTWCILGVACLGVSCPSRVHHSRCAGPMSDFSPHRPGCAYHWDAVLPSPWSVCTSS